MKKVEIKKLTNLKKLNMFKIESKPVRHFKTLVNQEEEMAKLTYKNIFL